MIVALAGFGPNNQAMIEKESTPAQKAFAANFELALAEKGAPTPGQIAAECGVTEQAVSNWRRTGKITKENLAIVSRMTRWSIQKLMTGEEPQNGPKVNMKERRVSDSEWDHLQHMRVLPDTEREAEKARVAERAKLYEEYAEQVMRRARGEDE